jgi:hypothetical protein
MVILKEKKDFEYSGQLALPLQSDTNLRIHTPAVTAILEEEEESDDWLLAAHRNKRPVLALCNSLCISYSVKYPF